MKPNVAGFAVVLAFLASVGCSKRESKDHDPKPAEVAKKESKVKEDENNLIRVTEVLGPKIVGAWMKRMAVGWYGEDDYGDWRFSERKAVAPDALPAFGWLMFGPKYKAGAIAELPAPSLPVID